ncbi:MAG: hypothetical protein IJD37_05000 [Clostridia bacterium]|nr:hypothetical protein [Clostridia bacterium]
MTKIIEKIWKDDFELESNFGVNNRKLRVSERNMFRSREKLEAILDDNQKKVYGEYIEYLEEMNRQSLDEAFCEGFSIGMRITAEALLYSDEMSD